MKYVHVPSELPISEIRASEACFSPSRYVRFIPPKASTASWFAPLDKLILLRNSQIAINKGDWYHHAEIGDIDVTTGGVSFHKMRGYQLPDKRLLEAKNGDVLISTVRTYRKGIGIVSSDLPDLVTTKAMMNICGVTDHAPNLTLPYVYSFLRSNFFVEQVWSLLNRGVYPRMDKGALNKITIPIPSDTNAIRYVTALVQAIIEMETLIRQRNVDIHHLVDQELKTEQKKNTSFSYSYPTLDDIRKQGRLDAVIYDREYKEKIFRVQNYTYGTETPKQMGFVVTPGPSLELKMLGTRIDSDTPKFGFYILILPTNISEYGTMSVMQYLGTKKKLALLKQGDIVFGEAGFQKGRSVVLVDAWERCTTNAHGLYARRTDNDLGKSIFFRCIFNWYRSMRLIDIMAVGGSGGHLSPVYFDEFIHIPKFPNSKQAEIVRLYHNPTSPPTDKPTLDTFVDWHRRWNENLGIWELDREMKNLQRTLADVQEKIIEGKTVQVPI